MLTITTSGSEVHVYRNGTDITADTDIGGNLVANAVNDAIEDYKKKKKNMEKKK